MAINKSMVFDYRALRFLMGFIALAMPLIVTVRAEVALTSISASYYTSARDLFVGMLFVVGAFLWAYKGNTRTQSNASKVASLAAILVALFPTPEDECASNPAGYIHFGSAAVLFLILTYFCWVPFRNDTRGQGIKQNRRAVVYAWSGFVMLASILVIVAASLLMDCHEVAKLRIIYYGEAAALTAFGFAWIVSGKTIPYFADKEESLKLFAR